MTKKLSLFLLGGFLLLLLGCRADEAMLPEQTEKYFQVFGKQDEASLDYAKGFRYLYENYDSIQKQKRRNYTPVSQVYSKRQGFSQKSSNAESEYIDFRFHSTAFKFDNGDVWVYYPVIKGDMVAKIAVATLIENRTQVYLRLLNPETDYYREVHQLFHTAYERHRAERNSKVSARGSSNECEVGCHDIEEVVIVEPVPIPKRGGGVLFAYNYDGMYSGGGNCGDFDNCWDGYSTGGGGGGSGSDINSDIDDGNTDPCANIKKSVVDNPKMKEPLKKLFEKSKQSGEQGFKVKADGTTTDMIGGGEHSVNYGDTRGYMGVYHNHTPNGIKMQSIPDIIGIFEQIVNRDINVDVSSVFAGMVGTEACPSCDDGYKRYNYVVSFRGTEEDAKNLYQQYKNYDSKKDMIWYVAYAKELYENSLYRDAQVQFLNTAGLEKLFFDSLKKKNLDVNKFLLQRIDEKGNVSNISMENNASFFPNENPCN